MIETRDLTKTYRGVDAVRDVTFTAAPGRVTGFLGLNGSGKTTTMRMLLGLAKPSGGAALINGKRYRDLEQPLRAVGAVLEQGLSHPGQSGYAHMVTQALLARVSRQRVEELLEYVGLTEAGTKRTGAYSLGMRQRLAVATALLTDPPVLILDEPANGLDPGGMAWLRTLLRERAASGGTVLISSHLLAELELMVDDVVIIAEGRVRLAAPLASLGGGGRLRVRGRDPRTLGEAYERAGATVVADGEVLQVSGITAEDAGDIALHVGVAVYQMVTEAQNLEEVFMSLAGDA